MSHSFLLFHHCWIFYFLLFIFYFEMTILRFTTAGSVDDGKSTLIGRLLLDTGNIKQDILQSVSGGEHGINLAHLTDGLRAEREQGITIDVAYKYFSTAKRKYIITDAPGHFQYTRNLVTGASGVDVMIILIDAQNGITAQTRRHAQVASFLRTGRVVVAVNKMDALGYDQTIFEEIRKSFLKLAGELKMELITFIPISALLGDNISAPSSNMPWYTGTTLLDFLENYDNTIPETLLETRFSVQYVTSDSDSGNTMCFGKLLSGKANVGDIVKIDAYGSEATIQDIVHGYESVAQAEPGQNLCLRLDSSTIVTRGEMITLTADSPFYTKWFQADICWLDAEQNLDWGKTYIMRINGFTCNCCITLSGAPRPPLTINEFCKVIIESEWVIVCDKFSSLPENGRGIIIDPVTLNTSGAFVICTPIDSKDTEPK